MKRIGLLYDYDFQTRPGGATRLLDHLKDGFVAAKLDSGYELVPCFPNNLDRECDAYVLGLTKLFSEEEYQFILGGTAPYSRYELDYWRSIEPNYKWCDKLNAAAKLVVLGSPLHAQVYGVFHPMPLDVRQTIIAYALNPQPFIDIKVAVEKSEAVRVGTCWYGEWHWFKGPDIAARWAGENEQMLDMFSPSMPQGTMPVNRFTRVHGFLPEAGEDGNGFYKTIAGFKRFVHFPRHPEPYPYSILEAHLLGLEVVVSGRLGVESWGDGIDATIKRASTGAIDFWNITMEELGV